MDRPRAADAAAAALDDAVQADVDPSVSDVVDAPAPGSRSPTPPPASQLDRLLDEVASRVERGEEAPGIADGDELLEGRPESDAEDNVQAVAAAEKRRVAAAEKRHRTQRTSASDDDTDSGVTAAVSRRKSGAKTAKRPRSRSPEPVDSDSSDHRPTSRHKPASTSAIYTAHEGPILSDVRRRFQTLIFVRDGSPIKTLTIHRHLNFKLALTAAKDVMEPKIYRDFKNAMEIAYKDTTKE